LAQHVTDAIRPGLQALSERLEALAADDWDKASIAALFKEVLKEQGLKMPQLAMPVRVLTVGTAHTPSVDAVLFLLGQQKVVERLKKA
jgi:glutamyl-tRNA synthetase